MTLAAVNFLAVLITGAVGMGIGAFWYSPAAFGKQWAALMGFSESQRTDMMKKATGITYALYFLCPLVMAFVLSQLIANLGLVTLSDAAMLGVWVWLGFIATTMLGSVLWEGKPWQFYGINIGYQLVSIVVMSIILTLWA